MNQFDETTSTPDLIEMLKDTRIHLEFYKAEMKSILDAIKASGNYQIAEDNAKQLSEKEDALTAEIKERALREFQATSNKNPFAGVKVKIFKVLKVVDEKAMQMWVLWNLKAAIKTVYDMKMIEKFAKENPVDGIQIDEEARVEIASEL